MTNFQSEGIKQKNDTAALPKEAFRPTPKDIHSYGSKRKHLLLNTPNYWFVNHARGSFLNSLKCLLYEVSYKRNHLPNQLRLGPPPTPLGGAGALTGRDAAPARGVGSAAGSAPRRPSPSRTSEDSLSLTGRLVGFGLKGVGLV